MPTSAPANKANKTTILYPHVRIIGTAAVVTYSRIVQSATAFVAGFFFLLLPAMMVSARRGAMKSARYEETRVYELKSGGWVNVHFHRTETKQ